MHYDKTVGMSVISRKGIVFKIAPFVVAKIQTNEHTFIFVFVTLLLLCNSLSIIPL